jgi:hypothetical protein
MRLVADAVRFLTVVWHWVYWPVLIVCAIFVPIVTVAVIAAVVVVIHPQVRVQIPLLRARSVWRVAIGCLVLGSIASAAFVIDAAVLAVAWFSSLGATGLQPLVSGVTIDVGLNALVAAPIACAGVVVAAWRLAEPTPNMPFRRWVPRYLPRFALLALLPPAAILSLAAQFNYRRYARGAWQAMALAWLPVYVATAGIVALLAPPFADPVTWWHGLWLVLRFVTLGSVLIAVSAIVRSAFEWPSPPADASSQVVVRQRRASQDGDWAGLVSRSTAWIMLSLLWLVVVVAAVFPAAELAASRGGIQNTASAARLGGILLAAVPTAVVSVQVLARGLTMARVGPDPWSSEIWTAVAGAVLLVAVILISANSAIEVMRDDFLVFVEGAAVGAGTGVGIGMARRLAVDMRMIQFGGIAVVVVFSLVLAVAIASSLDSQFLQHPEYQPRLVWFIGAAVGLACLAAGLVVGQQVLIRGFGAFAVIGPYLSEWFWPLVGFAAGYLLLALGFAGLYFAAYRLDDTPHLKTNVSHGKAVCVQDANSNVHFVMISESSLTTCNLAYGDFVLFSLNTIAPLGYSNIHPRADDRVMQTIAWFELGIGILWTVVVFGAFTAAAGDRRFARTL